MDDRERTPLPLTERPRPTIRAAAAAMLLAAVGMWVASLLVSRAPIKGRAGLEFLYDALFYLPFVALPIALYTRRRPGLSAAMRLNPLPVLPAMSVILAAILSVYAASAIDGLWGMLLDAIGLHEPDLAVEIQSSRTLTQAILYSAAIPAVFEELLCRGFVFPAFERRGTWRGLWASALLFALLHGNLYGLPAYLLVGAISAFLVFALDSLYAGIVYHTVYNAVILVILYMIPRMRETVEAAPAVSPMSVAIDAVCIGLLLFLTLRLLDRRRRLQGIEPVPPTRAPLRKSEWALLIALALVFIATHALVLWGV